MADSSVTDPQLAAELKKKRTFRTFSYRGVELEKLLDMNNEDFVELVHARARRRFQRGLKRRPMGLIKKLRKAKKEAPPNEKPAVVKTHLRDMIIVPEMIGSVVGIYNGKVFNSVEIKPEMTGHYLAEFSCSYRPVKHGRPGIGATHCERSHHLRTFPNLTLSSPSRFVQLLDSSPSSKEPGGMHLMSYGFRSFYYLFRIAQKNLSCFDACARSSGRFSSCNRPFFHSLFYC
ncbi:ribosomal protein S19-domain-containing protein [Collybia nuda]|uniref:Ribosomal protein S19-domain-containing protein n=1 Tax=Collybia nuda TaxID=64659 RepID=A0A9P5Y445_9AGAR|nr:ribosomal protein S19-domain-containing protein [Collybia nuda]